MQHEEKVQALAKERELRACNAFKQ